MVLLLTHLLLAQLTLLLAVAFYLIGRLSRWRLLWLAVPAAAGLLWTLAIGPARAAAGLTAGPRQVLDYLGGIGRHPGHLLHLQDAFAGITQWLPQQFPLALVLAAAEVLGVFWLQGQRDGGRGYRPGLVVATRRRWTTASLRSGGVVTRDGCCLGLDVATGRGATVSWQEAEGGVLCAGAAQAGPAAGPAGPEPGTGASDRSAEADLTETGFTVAHAAIRRRKPLVVIDLTGSLWLAEAVAAACTEPGAPLARFGDTGPGYYEPVRGGDPARAAGLVMSMLDWSDVGDRQRRSCAAYLTDALAVQAAAPGDRRVPALVDLLRLLTPDGLRERAAQLPAYHPRREVLADRASVSASMLQADPETVAAPVAQLPRLRASALGRWLQPAPPGAEHGRASGPEHLRASGPEHLRASGTTRISLGQIIRDRGVALFSLSRRIHGRSATMIANLAVADLMTVCTELQGMSVPGDSLAWINGCEVLDQQTLADLVTQGQGAGMAVMLSTTSAELAGALAPVANVLVARGPVDPGLAGRFAGPGAAQDGADTRRAPGTMAQGTAVVADIAFGINGDHRGETFALLARAPRLRMLPRCRHVPARAGGWPA
ncbi:MAG TPA: hypothetical protein VGJ50_02785 [Streptosporangiaceae bacterium]